MTVDKNKSFAFEPPEKARLDWLRAEIRRHDDLYYNRAAPEIPDDRYDALFAELRALEQAHPEWDSPDSPTHRVGAAPLPRSKKDAFRPHRHAVPMLSIANTYSADEIRKFAGRVEAALRDAGDARPPRFVVELKIDGVASAAFYRDGEFVGGATRGDGSTGEDIGTNLRAIAALPKKLKAGRPDDLLEVRGEIYLPAAAFKKLVEEQEEEEGRIFSNPRNAAAGSLKLLDPAVVAERGLECFFYQIVGASELGIEGQEEGLRHLAEWGLPVNPLRGRFERVDDIIAFRDRLDGERHGLPYGTDGLVIKLDSFAQQETLGLGTRAPNWAVAYKFAPERAETGVAGIRVQVGKLGRLTPVADLEPVFLAGSTITHASLHNESYIAEKDVRVGDRVWVEKAGEIIPQIHAVIREKRPADAVPFAMPRACPSCGGDSVTTEGPGQDGRKVILRFCPNPVCPAKQFARIVHFASRDAMDIEGMGPAAVEWLLEHHLLKDVSDIYRLAARQLLPMTKEGRDLIGKAGEDAEPTKVVDNLLAAVAESRRRGLAKVLFALSIPDVGETAAQILARRFKSLERLRAATEEEIAAIPMGESTAYRTLGDKSAALLAGALAKLGPADRAFGQDAGALALFLESLRLPQFGKKKCEAVAKYFGTIDNLLKASQAELAMAEMGASQVKRTLGPVAAKSLKAFLADPVNAGVLERLAEAGVILDDNAQAGVSPVAGKVFVLTGTLPNLGRAEAKRRIEAAGGLVAGGVSQKVDYLVAGADPGSKLAKATELGIAIIDEAGMLSLLER